MAQVVNLTDGRRDKPSLEPLITLCRDDMVEVNRLIIERMDSSVPLIPQLAAHLVAAGGKRLRPLLTVAASRLCGYGEASDQTRHRGLAACVEFIHTATLLHDDVVDESTLRRGQDSANAVFGNKASVLVGDFLFSRAFELMVADGSLPILAILSRASAVIAEGEVLQMTTANDTDTNEAAYLEVIKAKTAQLFAAAARIGAVLGERPRAEEDALESYGMNLGIAFQLVDDMLDYSARQAELGKTVGDDFREGKITLPSILAFHRGSEQDREFWRRTLERQEHAEGDLEYAQNLLHQTKALSDTAARARHYGAIAKDALGRFADSPTKVALLEAVDFAIERAH